MISLYLIPYNALLLMIILCSIAIVFQTLSLVHANMHNRNNYHYSPQTVIELAILGLLFVQIHILAYVLFNTSEASIIEQNLAFIRYFFYFVIVINAILINKKHLNIYTIAIILNATLTIPLAENLPTNIFPFALIISLIFWLLRAINNLFEYLRREKEEISSLSIKEALDKMDFGLLFFKADKSNDGQIILVNNKMQELIHILVGHQIYNGRYFYNLLLADKVLLGSTKQPIENQIVYKLPNNQVYNFKPEIIKINNLDYILLVASDKTDIQNANLELYHQQEQLEIRNKELRMMLNNLEELCRNEETLSAKARVHDLLGQRISLILSSVREHKKPDEELLASIANGLLEELRNSKTEHDFSIGKLAANFKNLGIDVQIEGQLPENNKIKAVFYKIIAEAMTNAIRHGFATEISIIIEKNDNISALLIRDNGNIKDENIIEGGGLTNMRKLVNEIGGEFAYESKNGFTILVKVDERNIEE